MSAQLFLNQTELSRRWKISPRTLERWRWLGTGPRYHKIGGRVVYKNSDKGYIKCLKTPHPLTKQTAERSKYGYLVVENMQLGQDEIDATGEIMTSAIAVLPTHYKDEGSGGVRQVENAQSWVYHDEEKAR